MPVVVTTKHLHQNAKESIFCLMVLIRLWIELRFRQRMLHSYLVKCHPGLDMMWTLWTSTEILFNEPR